MKSGIIAYLKTDASLMAAITGIYSYPVPASATYPYLLIKRNAQRELIGTADDDSGPFGYVEDWQVDIHAQTFSDLATVEKLLILALHNKGSVEMGDYMVYSCFLNGDSEFEDIEPDASREPHIVRSKSFEINRER